MNSRFRRPFVVAFASALFFAVPSLKTQAAPSTQPKLIALFDGKSFKGWEGDTNNTWRIEDGALVGGSLEVKVPHNEFLATLREFENFDLHLKYKIEGSVGFVNGGLQFWSQRIPNHFEVSGYQADAGAGTDGNLYDESRRRKNLAVTPAEVLKKALKTNDWNDYHIRAEGQHIRIWLNGVQTVDYTEAEPNIATKGIIAVQIHGGAKAIARYKDLMLEELPPTPADPLKRIRDGASALPATAFESGRFSLRTGDVAVFTGPANMVFEQQNGWLETLLAAGAKDQKPRFRHMGWEGDTVYEQSRDLNFGGWPEQLTAVGASVVFAWFGQNEAMDDSKSVEDFTAAYSKLLDEFAKVTPRLVIIAPAPFEKPASQWIPDNTTRNSRVKANADAARRLAVERGAIFVDLYSLLSSRGLTEPRLTENGFHFNIEGQRLIAELITRQLGFKIPATGPLDALRVEIVAKNRLWFDCWRTMNWAFAYGDRTEQPFGQSIGKNPDLAQELEQFKPLIHEADARVHAIALDETPPVSSTAREAAVEVPQTTLPPEEERKSFKVRDGFDAKLFASEADGLVKPLQIRWDERGRLWAACSPTYPQLVPGAKPADYILICEDTDGDGRADKFTRYAEGLFMPWGFEFGDSGVYVCEGTQLIHLRDTTGSGHANERRVVLSGFGTADAHQLINSVRWGPDGDLWFTQGHHIRSRVETPRGLTQLNRAGLYRFNPRTDRLDAFFNESTAGLNGWGVNFDNWGQVFHASGANRNVYYSVPGLIPTGHAIDYQAVGGICESKGKSMEVEIIGTRHLPGDLQGVLIKSVYFTSQVSLYRLRDDASGFKSEELGDLLSSPDNAFRPTETKIGPDGAIYVCDWFNPIIGHYQASYRDPRRDKAHGRIWRLTAKDSPLVKWHSLANFSAPQLLDELRSPERWNREQARRLLFNLPAAEVIPAANLWLATAAPLNGDAMKAAPLLYEIIGVHAAHEDTSPALLDRLLNSPEPHLRAYGTRFIGLWTDRLADSLGRLRKMVTDESPRVRLEAVVASSYLASPAAIELATMALDRPRDKFIDYALTQCVFALKPQWQPLLAEGKLDFGGSSAHLGFVLQADGSPDVVAQLRRSLSASKLSKPAREDLLAVLVNVGEPDDLRFALDQATQSPRLLGDLVTAAQVRQRKPSGDLASALQPLVSSGSPEVRSEAFRLAGYWKERSMISTVTQAAISPATALAPRRAAIEALASFGGDSARKTLMSLAGDHAAPVRSAALAALAGLDVKIAARLTAENLSALREESEVTEVFSAFLQRKGGPSALAEAFSLKAPPKPAAETALRLMSATGRRDEQLARILNGAAGFNTEGRELAPEEIAAFATEVRTTGDARHGGEIFHRTQLGCTACHSVSGQGGVIGPDLSGIGAGAPPEFIIESVLYPNKVVKEGYMSISVTTRDGDEYQGNLVRETKDELVLHDNLRNQEIRVRRGAILERKQIGSVMPQGLAATLTRTEFRDLIRYLSDLGKTKP